MLLDWPLLLHLHSPPLQACLLCYDPCLSPQLKDLSDSRRIAATIRSTRANPPVRRGGARPVAPVAPVGGTVHPVRVDEAPDTSEASALARAGARAGVDESDDEDEAGPPVTPASAAARRAERAAFDGSPLPLPRALLLSRLFWPGLAGYGGETPTARPPATLLHPRLQHGLKNFTQDFETAKAPRKLVRSWFAPARCEERAPTSPASAPPLSSCPAAEPHALRRPGCRTSDL